MNAGKRSHWLKLRIFSAGAGLCILTSGLSGQTAPQVSVTPARKDVGQAPLQPAGRLSIGLALEGGGALGLAHVGVFKWMRENHIPVDRIAGTSMGALVGSLIATGHSPEQMEQLVGDKSFEEIFALRPSLSHLSFRRREDRDELPQAFTIGLRGKSVSVGNALINDDRLNALLIRELLAYNTDALHFDDLPVPFRCVATDLTTLHPAVFGEGSLPFAIRASISIPGVFQPVNRGGDVLVDGAIVDNLPTDVLRRDLHADVVIAVHLSDSAFETKDATSIFGIFGRAFQAGTNRNEELGLAQADVRILPAVAKYSPTDYSQGVALVKAGYDAAEAQRAKLIPYALREDDWKAYEAGLDAKRRPAPGVIRVVHVDGPDVAVSAKLARDQGKMVDHPFDFKKAETFVSDVSNSEAFDAYYETFHTPVAAAATAGAPVLPDDGVVLRWRPKADGPPYLLVGMDVVAANSNVTSTTFDLRFVDQNLGGYGSELRSDVRIGYLTRLGMEYYRPIGGSGFFVQPSVQLLRQPAYLWEDQKRVSERLLQRAGGGLAAGVTVNRNLQAEVEYQASTVRWTLKEGADASPNPHLSGMTESVAAHVTYSDRTAEIASPKGRAIDLKVGELFDTTASANSPFLKASGKQTFTFAHKNLLSLSADANTYFRHNVADPLRFTMGGPLRLYASSVDEYRGTDAVLARAIYLRRIASLPTGLGQGIYFTTGYEAGNIWSPETHYILRQDVFGGLLLNTPLGAITAGGAIGDAGRRKVFFTFGKLF